MSKAWNGTPSAGETHAERIRRKLQWAFRDECLNENSFSDLADARAKIAEWKQDYNERRPHSSLQ